MEDFMKNLVANDFVLTEDSYDAVAYNKDASDGTSETFTFLLLENSVLHERYNKNGVQTYSNNVSMKETVLINKMFASFR